MALLAVGHLVGLWVGVAMGVGALIAWGWARAALLGAGRHAPDPAADLGQATWATYVRFVGAGTIGVAAIWTLAKLVKPVVSGLASAMAASRVRKAGQAGALPRTGTGHPDRRGRHDLAGLLHPDRVPARRTSPSAAAWASTCGSWSSAACSTSS